MARSPRLNIVAIKWDCTIHQRPVNASCEQCASVVNALKEALPGMASKKMRRFTVEIFLGFAACQYGLAVAGNYGLGPQAEQDARRVLHAAVAHVAAESAKPPRRRR